MSSKQQQQLCNNNSNMSIKEDDEYDFYQDSESNSSSDEVGSDIGDFTDNNNDNEDDGDSEYNDKDTNGKFTEEEKDKLMFDDQEDEDNQAWVDKTLRGNSKSKSTTDAKLNCPACFTLLCVDCQQHTTYKHQFRAMFVMNCRIDLSKRLQYDKSNNLIEVPNNNNQNNLPTSNQDIYPELDLYYAVSCANCDVQVAVYDSDEIYHFFNVFPSN